MNAGQANETLPKFQPTHFGNVDLALDYFFRQGAKGDEIIEALIANSATFEKKTAFSQEKYRIKKEKKYAPRVLLSICEAYFKKYPNRIGYLVLMEEDITSLPCFQDIGSPRYKMTIRSTNGPLVCVSLEIIDYYWFPTDDSVSVSELCYTTDIEDCFPLGWPPRRFCNERQEKFIV
ncbi:hypothetical protein D5086_011599 [Populus alba]|uniref:Uncharacterized protein n=1 Tax=Populus alba TaxID=43335 RepID=A0ACC4CE93_POPAL